MIQEEKLEEAKRLYQTANADQRYVLESLFPELVESEEEKNIKDLIDELKCSLRAANCQNDACRGGHEKRIALLEWAIAWLERQGKNDSQVIFPPFTFDDILALQCCMETVKKVQEDKDLYEKLEDLHGRVYDAYHLEKQGEQKLANSTKTCKDEDTLLSLLQQMPSCITVDGIDYHFVMKKTIVYMVFYEGGDESSRNVIFWMAGDPIDICKEMLKRLEKEGLTNFMEKQK